MAKLKEALIDLYTAWLRDGSFEEEIEGGWKSLSLPFLDRHNDYLQVFVTESPSGGLHITDEGQTFRDLKETGFDPKSTARRRGLAERILKAHGLSPDLIEKGELKVSAANGDFPEKLHSLLQSMLAIDGLAVAAPAMVASIFKDDVAAWLSAVDAPFKRGAKFVGKTGLEHTFDFIISSNDMRRDRVVHTVSKPDTNHIQSLAYQVMDTREALNGNSPEFYAFLDDSEGVNLRQSLTLLGQQITPIYWSERDKQRAVLV